MTCRASTWDIVKSSILRQIDEATEPGLMSKKEALEALEGIAADLEGRMDALRTEIANEEDAG